MEKKYEQNAGNYLFENNNWRAAYTHTLTSIESVWLYLTINPDFGCALFLPHCELLRTVDSDARWTLAVKMLDMDVFFLCCC